MAKKRHNPMQTRAGRLAHVRFCHETGLSLPNESGPGDIQGVQHPPEVLASIRATMSRNGIDNPGAFFQRWTPEEILPELTEVVVSLNNDKRREIKSPGGVLWARLEYAHPGRSTS